MLIGGIWDMFLTRLTTYLEFRQKYLKYLIYRICSLRSLRTLTTYLKFRQKYLKYRIFSLHVLHILNFDRSTYNILTGLMDSYNLTHLANIL